MDYEEQVGYCLTFTSAWQNESRTMSLLKLLTLLLVIWIFWFMARNYVAKQTQKKPARRVLAQKMVQCHQCSVHTPESEAFFHDSHWFCNQAHLQAYLGNKAASDK